MTTVPRAEIVTAIAHARVRRRLGVGLASRRTTADLICRTEFIVARTPTA